MRLFFFFWSESPLIIPRTHILCMHTLTLRSSSTNSKPYPQPLLVCFHLLHSRVALSAFLSHLFVLPSASYNLSPCCKLMHNAFQCHLPSLSTYISELFSPSNTHTVKHTLSEASGPVNERLLNGCHRLQKRAALINIDPE